MSWLDDLRHAARALLARPGFTLTAVLTLMLGIGAITAIFTVYDAVLLRPLPFDQPERIVQVVREEPPVMTGPVSAPVFREWSERSHEAFEAMGAFTPQTMSLTGSGNAERFTGYAVTPGFWDVLHQPIALGRGFGASEDTAGERVVFGDAVWRIRYAADPAIVGRDSTLSGERWRVIGIARPGCRYPHDARLWTPAFLSSESANRSNNSLAAIARLPPGVTLTQAREIMCGSGLAIVVPGILAGLLGALALSRLLANQVPGLATPTVRVLGMLALGFATPALMACLIPARRTLRVSPVEALRDD